MIYMKVAMESKATPKKKIHLCQARRASSRKKENARRTRRMSPQNLFNRVRRKFRKASHRDILLSHTNTCARSSTDETIAAEETAIFENAIDEASSILPISRKKDLTKDDIAAIKIQAFFRGHLVLAIYLIYFHLQAKMLDIFTVVVTFFLYKIGQARRAFLALRSLVKLQAVVRGVGIRRQARVALHCMHALARLQVRVRARQLLINGEELS